MIVPNINWKTTTMTAISKLRMSGPYSPGWVNSWAYHVSVNVPCPLRTDEVKLKAKTVANGPRTKRPNRNQTTTVQTVLSKVAPRKGQIAIGLFAPLEHRGHPPTTYFGNADSNDDQRDQS